MGRVLTNTMTLAATREASLGVLPGSPVWGQLEPNTINAFGTTITKTARNPISQARERRKGAITDLDSSVEFESDLTLSVFRDYMSGFLFSNPVGPDVHIPSAAGTNAYTVPAVSAAAAGRLIYGASAAKSLLYARGFNLTNNNGLFVLGATVATSATSITVAAGSGVTAETPAATVDVELAIAGVRGAAGDLKISASGHLTSTALDFTTLGLTVGQWIHIGGLDVTHQFFNTANYGFARIKALAAGQITLERRGTTFVTDDGTSTGSGGTNLSIDILFGQFIRNVPVSHADYREISTQFELTSANLGPSNETMFEYAKGNWHDAVTLNIPLTEKATVSYGFIGTDTTEPSTTRATNAANAKFPSETGAFSTSSDLARLTIEKVDETGISTDFKSMTVTLTNNVSPEKVLAKLGPKYMAAGNFEADIQSEMLFTSPDVLAAIRRNTTLGLHFALRNDDGGVMVDFPAGTLGDGNRSYPENQTVTINATFMAHRENSGLTYTLGVSLFPVLPALTQ